MARWVRFRWPESFRGDPYELGRQADLVVRDDGDDILRATTAEDYHRRHPRYLDLLAVVSEANRDTIGLDRILERWPRAPDVEATMPGRVEEEAFRLLGVDKGGDTDVHSFFEAVRLLFMCAPNGDFEEWVQHGLLDSLRGPAPNYRLCLVRFSDTIHTRTAFIRALFCAEHAEEWILPESQDRSLRAMSGLYGAGFQGNSTFLDPLVASHVPWMFGTTASRIRSGMAVFLFDGPMPGRERLRDSDLISALSTSHLVRQPVISVPRTPELPVEVTEAAVRWWVSGVNRLIAMALDPTLFADGDGFYTPEQHSGYVLSLDRLFASVISLLVHTGSDEYTRRVHLFDALDILEGLGLGGYDQTLNVEKLADHLNEVRHRMDDGTARVLLARCEVAVEKLAEFADGFHPERVTADGRVQVEGKNGTTALKTANAASQYLRVVRNAGHSMRQEITRRRSLSLLTAHDGEIPAEVSDLAFLHLVRLVADPDLIAAPLMRRLGRA